MRNDADPIEPPVLFLLHALGGSARAWDGIVAALGNDFESIPIDLPGFGDAATSTGADIDTSVLGMADWVASVIRSRSAPRWLLVGHSMGGKIASVVAAQALDGEAGLFGLAGVVLLAASPPSPEPMDESRRDKMIGWAANGPLDDAAAREFIDGNVGGPLSESNDRAAMRDLKRSSRSAWTAWLERGSREDWSAAVGTLDLPSLIIVGGEDGDLGEDGQRATNSHVYPRSRLVCEAGAGHLLPLERPREVAAHIARFWHESAGLGPIVPSAHAKLIDSDRVSRRTRGTFAHRALADATDYEPRVLTPLQLTTLRALADRIVPQSASAIDLAARLDARLAAGKGDGWRHADLPPDAEAYAAALDSLRDFATDTAEAQDERLAAIAAGAFDSAAAALSASQMKRWFEDARTDLVGLWLAHPATMARIGFDGYANGGDGPRKQGYDRVGADEREAWEPSSEVRR